MLSDSNNKPTWLVVLNPRAGGRSKTPFQERIVSRMGETACRFLHTHPDSGAIPAVEQGLMEGFKDFVVVGGDGTIQSAASVLIGTEARMGIIPAGSGNGFAEWLGIQKDIDQNLTILESGRTVAIDTGSINSASFVNLAGVGVDGAVAHATKNSRLRGFWPYFFASIRLVFGRIFWRGKIILDGQEKKGSFLTVVVANGAIFGYGFHIAREASVDDGLFTVVIIRKTSRWRYFLALPGFFRGRFKQPDWMETLTARQIEIQPDSKTLAHADGEALPLSDRYTFNIRPSSLQVIIP